MTMMIRFSGVLLGLLLLASSNPACAEQLVREFSGSRSSSTAEFEVEAPWVLDWRATGDHNSMSAVDVGLFNVSTSTFEGKVLTAKYPGNGVKLFNESGRFYLRVDATLMGWTLKVIQLTKEEAALYTPKTQHVLDQ
jgi:hypothetical protein